MIIGWLLAVFVEFMDGVQSQTDAHGADFQFSGNTNLLAVISYMMQANHFIPIDQYLIIGGLYSIVYSILGALRVARVVYGAIPGGQKLEI